MTAAEIKKAIESAQERLIKSTERIAEAIARNEKAVILSQMTEDLNKSIQILGAMQAKLEEVKQAEAVSNDADNLGVVVEFLQEMKKKDIEWFEALYADYMDKGYEVYLEKFQKRQITKQVLEMLRSGTDFAKKVFEQDLQNRLKKLKAQIKEKAGNVIECDLRRNNNMGFDGTIRGDKGTIHISTIVAGGYNIQRVHYRTLIK